MINETNIACFLSVAETQNFTESARRLFLSQQAVSKNVMQLEADVGFNLIDRAKRGAALTPEGEQYRKLLLQISDTYSSEIDRIKMYALTHEKNVDICCQNFLDLGAGLKRAVDQAKKNDPNLSVRVNRFPPAELLRRLYDGATNMVIMYGRYAPLSSELTTAELFRTRTAIIISANHPNLKPDSTYLDFRNEPYIIDYFPGETEAAIRQRAKRECAHANIVPSEIIPVPNRESAYSTAELGQGILLGTDLSMIPASFGLIRYRTDASEPVSCVYNSVPGSVTDEIVELLKKNYSEEL